MNSRNLKDRTAVVTGASKGLGKAIALALADAGASLALVSRNVNQLQTTEDEIKARGGKAEVFLGDVTDELQVRELEKQIGEELGRVSILVNNAGINIRKPVTDFTLEEWNRVMNTNLTGAFLMCRAFVPHMKELKHGRILNLTSIMAHVGLPERTAYCASKSGLLGMTHALALELAPNGITVNGISPGPFGTEMNQVIMQNPTLNQQFISKIPIGRWGKVEEIGQLAVFLCSDDAGFITGTDILIDGGWTAQ